MSKTPPRFYMKMFGLSLALWGCVHGLVLLFTTYFEVLIDGHEVRCLPDTSTYLLVKGPFVPKNGDIMAFKAKGMMPFYADGETIGKLVAAIPGDAVKVVPAGASVNDEQVVAGSPLTNAATLQATERTLGTGEFFVIGTHPRSYDSRYWGTVKTNQVIGRLIPLW